MSNKRKRDPENLRRPSTQKDDVLPLASEELTDYHVDQLQESNRFYKQRISQLENEVSEMVSSIGNSDGDVDAVAQLKKIIAEMEDKILELQNENRRISMQKIYMRSFGNNGVRTKAEGGDSLNSNLQSIENNNSIDLNVKDLQSKLSIKEKEIEELTQKNRDIMNENTDLRKKFSIFVPCKIEELNKNENSLNNYVCKCVELYSKEINRLENELKHEREKTLDLINNDIFGSIKEFIENKKKCQEHTETRMCELFEVKSKYDSLRADFEILEKKCEILETRERDQIKKIRDLEYENNKAEVSHSRITQIIENIGKSTGNVKDEQVLNDLMNEYEELSNAFEEKNIECDKLKQKIQESEEKYAKCNVGLESIQRTLEELKTVRILYDEKLSLIRKNKQNEIKSRNGLDLNINKCNKEHSHLDFFEKLGDFLSIKNGNKEDSTSSNLEQAIKHKIIIEGLESEINFYKDQVESIQNKLNAAEKNDKKNLETIFILRERVQYIVNKINKLTNLKIDLNNTEKNEHLKLDDLDDEITKLKSENQQMLTLMKCSVCKDKLKDTVINRCGHLFCKECICNNLSSRNRKCPLCHATFDKNDIIKVFLE
ncbi:hypothetical protein FG386_001849 [Cryptosporidium ryanae]|uniref:uncharacterized protein n=1 Tax=Cryptosporidium ryanae TaxID=515981 RepID=UPI00351A4132|nr:hypothetical protein FG386_001849 [Cryptosporidium ryanae]